MVKAMPPSIVTAERLEYSGGLSEEEMKTKLIEYFNTLTDTSFDISDIISVMYDNGATYVNTDMDVSIREYDTEYRVTISSLAGSTYTIDTDNVSRFYTNQDELYGVTQV
jgi:hypothetical protein